MDEVASILTALGVRGTSKERLLCLAADESQTWVGIGDGISQQLSAVSAYEADATAISTLQISIFPGLLQTSDYARVLVSTSPLGSAERERAVFTRVGRQSVLSRPGLESYTAFIDEAAFRRSVGSARIMVDQLSHILHVERQPGKTIKILPFDAGTYWGCEGAFIMYELVDDHRVIFLENQGSGTFIDDKSTEAYKRVLDNLEQVALDTKESEKLIVRYREWYQENDVQLP